MKKKKNNISGHIRLVLLSVPLSLVSHYSAFFVRGTDTNANGYIQHCCVLTFETYDPSVIYSTTIPGLKVNC